MNTGIRHQKAYGTNRATRLINYAMASPATHPFEVYNGGRIAPATTPQLKGIVTRILWADGHVIRSR